MSERKNLRAAIIGTGFIAPVHVEALRRLGFPVVGILGSSPEKSREAARRLGVPNAYDDLDELLGDYDASVVHVTSPNHLHYEQCKQIFDSYRHVLCEKPLALTSGQAAEMVVKAGELNVAAAVCYNIRYYPLCQEARERIAAGELGTIYHVTGSYQQDWLLHETDFNWRVLSGQGGQLRAVADIGTHWMDLVTHVTGQDVENVCADLSTVIPVRRRPKGSVETFAEPSEKSRETEPVKIDTEDCGSVLLHFKGGARGAFTVSQVAAGRKNSLRFEVAGSKGSLAWDSERPNELWLGHRDRANELLVRDPALLSEGARPFAGYPGGHNEGFPDTFKQLFRSVYEYIQEGDFKAIRPFPTFEDGHREVRLCEAILQSHRERRWVEIKSK